MPIYEYECDACRCRFERKQGFLEEPVRVCPQCSGTTRRLIHPVGVVFKGNGFYVTDNRKSTYTHEEKKSIPVSGTPVSGAKESKD